MPTNRIAEELFEYLDDTERAELAECLSPEDWARLAAGSRDSDCTSGDKRTGQRTDVLRDQAGDFAGDAAAEAAGSIAAWLLLKRWGL